MSFIFGGGSRSIVQPPPAPVQIARATVPEPGSDAESAILSADQKRKKKRGGAARRRGTGTILGEGGQTGTTATKSLLGA